jgi:hypothetical protein
MKDSGVTSARRHSFESHGAFILAVLAFAGCLFFVFFGFVGYFSRVNLNTEFQNKQLSADFVFMTVDRLVRDEQILIELRKKRQDIKAEALARKTEALGKGYLSEEFKSYVEIVQKLQTFLEQNGDKLEGSYISSVMRLNFEDPDLNQARTVAKPIYKGSVSEADKYLLEENLSRFSRDLSARMVTYIARHKSVTLLIDNNEESSVRQVDSLIYPILKRNPQLGFDDELIAHKIQAPEQADIDKRSMAEQRAILRSYDEVLGGLSGIFLRLPTIVSTLVVTLATGLLGGITGFLGAAAMSRRTEETLAESHFASFFRRIILGVTAALGIFLFFGSGLLVLTAQNAKAVGSTSLELSPYFVAFLAFISGFLADDAFDRLRRAGQGIFHPEGADERKKEEKKPSEEAPSP